MEMEGFQRLEYWTKLREIDNIDIYLAVERTRLDGSGIRTVVKGRLDEGMADRP
jgi:hypothetical protein